MRAGRLWKNVAAFALCGLFASAGSVELAPLGPAALAACRMLGFEWGFPLGGALLFGVLCKNYAGALHSLCYFCLAFLFKNRRGSTKGQGLLLAAAALLTAPYFYISSWEAAFGGLAQLSCATVMAAAFFRWGRCMRRLRRSRPVKSRDVTAVLLCQGVLCGVLAPFAPAGLNAGCFAACAFALLWSSSCHCVTAAAFAGAGASLASGDTSFLAAAAAGAICAALPGGRWGRGCGFFAGALLVSMAAVRVPGEAALAAALYLLLPFELSLPQSGPEPLALMEAKTRAAATALLGISGMPETDEPVRRQLQAVSRSLVSLAPKPENGLSLEWACACLPKAGCRKAGDTAEVRELPFGKLVLLCDGMGSGRAARRESREAVSLIGDLIAAGIEEREALLCANRLLMEKGGRDMYATADVMTFHPATGAAEFFKLGACPTFILRGDEVTELFGEALPIGIVEGVQPAAAKFLLRRGDGIFMMTDGVYDVLSREVVSILRGLSRHDPALAARHLVQQAARQGRCDDMTVVAMRIK